MSYLAGREGFRLDSTSPFNTLQGFCVDRTAKPYRNIRIRYKTSTSNRQPLGEQTRTKASFGFLEVLTQPIHFSDPETTFHVGHSAGFDDQTQSALQLRETEPAGDANHDDAGVVAGSVLQRVRKIHIKCDEAATFRSADANDFLVRCPPSVSSVPVG